MALLNLSQLNLEQAGTALKNHVKNRMKNRLRREAARIMAEHLVSFWWVYAILLAVLLFFYIVAAAISSQTAITAQSFVTERFLPPQMYVSNLEDAITDGFGERIHPVTGEKSFHEGIDVGLPVGTPVSSSQDGIVKRVFYPKPSDPVSSKNAGIYVEIESSDAELPGTTRYLHLSNSLVVPGQAVRKGQIIGLSGNTGRSTGPHLHYELIPEGLEATDPTSFISLMSKLIDVASEEAFDAMNSINFTRVNNYDNRNGYFSEKMLYVSNVYLETAAPQFRESGTVYTRNMNTGFLLGSYTGGGGSSGPEAVVTVPSTLGVLSHPFFIKWAPYAMESEERTGIKASVTLAQMALESGWGKFDICNNVFGIKADMSWKGPVCYSNTSEQDAGGTYQTRAKFRAYSNYEESFDDHAQFLIDNPRYNNTRSKMNPFEWANELQRATYATDRQYANKLKSLMMSQNLISLDMDRGIDPSTGKPWKDVPYPSGGLIPSVPSGPPRQDQPALGSENTSETVTITFGLKQLYGNYARKVIRFWVPLPLGGSMELVTYSNLIDPYTGNPIINLVNFNNVIHLYQGEIQPPDIYVKDLPDAIAVTLESSAEDDLRVARVDFVKGQY